MHDRSLQKGVKRTRKRGSKAEGIQAGKVHKEERKREIKMCKGGGEREIVPGKGWKGTN